MTIEILRTSADGPGLSDLAYEQLRDRIVRVEIPPGAPLAEDRLSEEFGVGLTPIRNAVRRLSYEHLVSIYPRRGTFTADINIGDERWLTEVRLEIEGLSAQLAAERATEAERNKLLQLAEEIKTTTDNAGVTDLDAAFHRQIFLASRNPFLESSANLYFNLSLRIWYFCNQSFTISDTRGADQYAVASAIARRDAEGARKAACDHLLNASRTLRGLLGT
ncbi:MAG: GntR family transcriptional regulator [Rhizobiaceae bacterium]